MAERVFRSTHAAPSTPSMTPRARRKSRLLLIVPLSLSAVTGMVLGLQANGSPSATLPRHDRVTKSKALPVPSSAPREGSAALALTGGKYTVAGGDTVSLIAAAAGVSTAELLAANGLSWKTLIFSGQQLVIPRSTSGSSVPTMTPILLRHRVSAGDTLEMIGRAYGVQPRALMTANGLDKSSRLIVGQRLVIPDAAVMGELPASSVA